MNQVTKAVIAAIVVIAVVGGGIWLATSKKDDKKPSATTPASSASVAATITYDGSSFKADPETVKAGSTVKVVNTSPSTPLNFDSDPHPVHTDEPELNAGDIEPGQSKMFTVTKTGTWGFHNHLDPSQHGTLMVQ